MTVDRAFSEPELKPRFYLSTTRHTFSDEWLRDSEPPWKPDRMSSHLPRPTARHSSVSSDLRDATSSLLHLALAPHHHASPTPHTPHRRKSIEDLRVAPAFPSPRAPSPSTSPAPSRRKERLATTGSETGGASVTEGVLHPFADSGALLRRCTSEIDLDLGPDDEDESDFDSDVRDLWSWCGSGNWIADERWWA